MTQAQRTELYNELMLGVPSADTDEYAALLAKLTWAEIDRMAPVIDRWISAAFAAGLRDRGKTVDEIIELGERQV